MRVLLVTGEYPPQEGGVADYSRCLGLALAELGHTVDVLTGRGQAPGVPDERRITVHRVVGGWGWGSLMGLRKAVAVLRPDVVHLQYQTAAFGLHPAMNVLPWWIRRTTSVNTAVTYHDLRVPYLFPKAGRLREWVTMLPARWANLTLATNEADWRQLRAVGRPWRLALVPIGSNVPDSPPPGYDRAAWRAEHGIAPDSRLMVYFGFLNASKGGRTLVDVLARRQAELPATRLLMLGGRTGASDATNAGYLAAFESDLATAGLSEAVLWTGHVATPEVSAWLHAADVAVLPYADGASYRRGSLLACLAHGVPVVTTRPETVTDRDLEALATSDRPPTLDDGVAARLVPCHDREAFSMAVAEVLSDANLARRLGAGGREVAGWFGWDQIALRHVALYAEVSGPIA